MVMEYEIVPICVIYWYVLSRKYTAKKEKNATKLQTAQATERTERTSCHFFVYLLSTIYVPYFDISAT